MAVIYTQFLSRSLGRKIGFNVIIPTYSLEDAFVGKHDVYQPRKFKTVWLLHGFTGDEHDYIHNTNIIQYAQKYNVAVVMPPGCNQGYSDDPVGAKHFSFVAQELIEVARFLFPLSPLREDNVIGGLSMGALGAMKVGFAYPHVFSKVLMMSGCAMEITGKSHSVPWFSASHDGYGGRILGNEAHYKDTIEDAFAMMKKHKNENTEMPECYLTIGTNDYLLERCRYAQSQFKLLDIELNYEEVVGHGHTWEFWDLKLKEAFATFFG